MVTGGGTFEVHTPSGGWHYRPHATVQQVFVCQWLRQALPSDEYRRVRHVNVGLLQTLYPRVWRYGSNFMFVTQLHAKLDALIGTGPGRAFGEDMFKTLHGHAEHLDGGDRLFSQPGGSHLLQRLARDYRIDYYKDGVNADDFSWRLLRSARNEFEPLLVLRTGYARGSTEATEAVGELFLLLTDVHGYVRASDRRLGPVLRDYLALLHRWHLLPDQVA